MPTTAADVVEVLDLLTGVGASPRLPVRVELSDHAGGRHVDLHPLHFAEDGSAWQAGLDGRRFDYPADAWGAGSVGGTEVRCLSVRMQLAFHAGYEPREVDRHDLRLLDALPSPADQAP